MAASSSLSKPATLPVESKAVAIPKHPTIQAFEDFHRQPILEVVQQFLRDSKNVSFHFYFLMRLNNLTATENQLLMDWIQAHYGLYLEGIGNFEHLSAAECTLLGMMYNFIPQLLDDYKKRMTWFERGQSKGCLFAHCFLTENKIELLLKCKHPLALNNLALKLQGTSPQEAVKYYQLAIAHNSGSAYRNLGVFYYLGLSGLPQDLNKAYQHFTEVAKLGVPYAMANLGLMHEKGEHVLQNVQLAKEFYYAVISKHSGIKRYALTDEGYCFWLAYNSLCKILIKEKKPVEAAFYFRNAANLAISTRFETDLNVFFKNYGEIPGVFYHIAIGFQTFRTLETAVRARERFNELFNRDPGAILDLCSQWGDTVETFYPLIDLSVEEREKLIRTHNVLINQHVMPQGVAQKVMEFKHPVPSQIQEISEIEVAAKNCLMALKPLKPSSMITLFGCHTHLAIIQKAESNETSYSEALRKITGKTI